MATGRTASRYRRVELRSVYAHAPVAPPHAPRASLSLSRLWLLPRLSRLSGSRGRAKARRDEETREEEEGTARFGRALINKNGRAFFPLPSFRRFF